MFNQSFATCWGATEQLLIARLNPDVDTAACLCETWLAIYSFLGFDMLSIKLKKKYMKNVQFWTLPFVFFPSLIFSVWSLSHKGAWQQRDTCVKVKCLQVCAGVTMTDTASSSSTLPYWQRYFLILMSASVVSSSSFPIILLITFND